MPAYRPRADEQRIFDREIGQFVAFRANVDCVPLSAPVVGLETATKWSRAIRSVHMRDVEENRVEFASEPVHAPNTHHERRFHALLLMIGAEVRPLARGAGLRAFTKRLWRGRSQRWYMDEKGEQKRRYVPAIGADGKSGHQGGLAARLGCSVRTVDLYLRIARAAGFIAVHQIKAKRSLDKLPKHLKGRKYSYAVFDWLAELPRAVKDRLLGRVKADSTETPPAERASAPARGAAASAGLFLDKLDAWQLAPSRPPS